MKQLMTLVLVGITLLAGCTGNGDGAVSAAAIGIPTLRAITLDQVIDASEWEGALRFASTFVIADGTKNDGNYPFEVLIGSTAKALNVAVILKNITKNAYASPRTIHHDLLTVYLTGAEGPLSVPSDYILDANGWEYGSSMNEGYWNGKSWIVQPDLDPGRFNEGQPTGGRWARTGSDEPNQTLFWEFYIPRTSTLTDVDGFHAPGPTIFRMGVELERQAPFNESSDNNSRDFYPGDGVNPGGRLDPSGWLTLRID